MKRASARIATAVFSVVVFALAIGTLPVYADANPDNEGHHYGQIKHPKHPPVPTPTPAPTPAPVPLPSTNPVHPTAPSTNPVVAPAGTAHSSKTAVHVPVAGLSPIHAQSRAGSKQPAPQDPLWWLVLVILPALMAIWLIALKRLTGGRPSAHAQRTQESRPQAAGPDLVASPQV
ncbi:MAG TPA: hypothetical protein VHO95_06010 [Candidatus Dormibacteraeota bacterium]|nr:hypothetical protein [Candidatus Dormibacteraeota bacterium]